MQRRTYRRDVCPRLLATGIVVAWAGGSLESICYQQAGFLEPLARMLNLLQIAHNPLERRRINRTFPFHFFVGQQRQYNTSGESLLFGELLEAGRCVPGVGGQEISDERRCGRFEMGQLIPQTEKSSGKLVLKIFWLGWRG